MKRKQIVLGAILSVLILMSTHVLANTVQTEIQSLSEDILIKDQTKTKELLYQLTNDEIAKKTEKISNYNCNCKNDSTGLPNREFPVICEILRYLAELVLIYSLLFPVPPLYWIIYFIGMVIFDCDW